MKGTVKKTLYWGILTLLLKICISLDYQDRGLYYSDPDSLCCSNKLNVKDNLEVTIDVEDKEKKVIIAWGSGRCDSTIRSCAGAIFTFSEFLITEESGQPFKYKTQIPMALEVKKTVDFMGRLKLMVARVRVQVKSDYQTLIDFEPYKCVVFGDGQIHHFTEDNVYSKLALRCDKLRNPVEEINDFTQ